MFKNREEAGELLAQELVAFRNAPDGILLALPRGGVTVAYQLSLALHLPLDVLITRKIGAPGNPEYALGAVSETGAVYWNQEALSGLSLSERDLAVAVHAQQIEVSRRVALYRQGRPFPNLKDRTAIIVDDGLATGATFFASVATVRQARLARSRKPAGSSTNWWYSACRNPFMPWAIFIGISSRSKIVKYCNISTWPRKHTCPDRQARMCLNDWPTSEEKDVTR